MYQKIFLLKLKDYSRFLTITIMIGFRDCLLNDKKKLIILNLMTYKKNFLVYLKSFKRQKHSNT